MSGEAGAGLRYPDNASEEKGAGMSKAGFTGTRLGMTGNQRSALKHFLIIHHPAELHHGDCVGSDREAHVIACDLDIPRIVGHPPLKRDLRAWCVFDEQREPKTYTARDHDIVDETDYLIATPNAYVEERRSGTWLTARYARSQGKTIYLITPDGGIRRWRKTREVALIA